VAARLGNVDNVVLLLQHGAQPDCATFDLYTPLHIAAKEGHDEVAQALLDQGADQHLRTMVRLSFSVTHACMLSVCRRVLLHIQLYSPYRLLQKHLTNIEMEKNKQVSHSEHYQHIRKDIGLH